MKTMEHTARRVFRAPLVELAYIFIRFIKVLGNMYILIFIICIVSFEPELGSGPELGNYK